MKKSNYNVTNKFYKKLLILFLLFIIFPILISCFMEDMILEFFMEFILLVVFGLCAIIIAEKYHKELEQEIEQELAEKHKRENKQVKQEEYVIITNTQGKKSKKSVCKKCMKMKKRNRKRGNKNYE